MTGGGSGARRGTAAVEHCFTAGNSEERKADAVDKKKLIRSKKLFVGTLFSNNVSRSRKRWNGRVTGIVNWGSRNVTKRFESLPMLLHHIYTSPENAGYFPAFSCLENGFRKIAGASLRDGGGVIRNSEGDVRDFPVEIHQISMYKSLRKRPPGMDSCRMFSLGVCSIRLGGTFSLLHQFTPPLRNAGYFPAFLHGSKKQSQGIRFQSGALFRFGAELVCSIFLDEKPIIIHLNLSCGLRISLGERNLAKEFPCAPRPSRNKSPTGIF